MSNVWLAAGIRTPFVRVDGPFRGRDSLALSVPVVRTMGARAKGKIDFGVWGSVAPNLAYSNLAREVWLDAGLDPHAPTFTTVMQCSTSMVAAFQAASMLRSGAGELAMVGGVESMSRVQIGLSQELSDEIRRISQARDMSARIAALREIRLRDVHLYIPAVKNRVSGKSMGEHCEEMAKTWHIGREQQDQLALESHQRAVAGWERGFFEDLVMTLDDTAKDAFPRKDTSLEKLAKLGPVFDRESGQGTITAGNSSPLTDGAAALWVATDEGLKRLQDGTPRAKLVDWEMGAVDMKHEGLLMAPVAAIPRLLARRGLKYEDVALWELHEAFSAQIACHLAGLADEGYVQAKAGVPHTFGRFPVERMNPNGGSVALGHPFAATGARILGQAVKQMQGMKAGSKAVVSICADGGLGTVALLEV